MTYFVVRTRKSARNPRSTAEIEGYELSSQETSIGVYYTKAQFFQSAYHPSNAYFSYNSRTGDKAALSVRNSLGGRYLQSVADNRDTNNLLELPDC